MNVCKWRLEKVEVLDMAVSQWCSGEGEGQADTQPLCRLCGEEKSSFHINKGWFEYSIKHISLHKVKRMGESESADHVAGTNYRAFQEDNQRSLLNIAHL